MGRAGPKKMKRIPAANVLSCGRCKTIMKKFLLVLAVLTTLGFAATSPAQAGVVVGIGVGSPYYGGYGYGGYGYGGYGYGGYPYGYPYGYGYPGYVYYGPGYYPWYHGYYHGGYYGGYHGGYYGHGGYGGGGHHH